MKLILHNLKIPIENNGPGASLLAASISLSLPLSEITIIKILSQKIDIKDKNQFFQNISLVVETPPDFRNPQSLPVYTPAVDLPVQAGRIPSSTRPIVVGFGPAGMFASLELIRNGYKPIIFERGKKIGERTQDVEHFITCKILNTESNIQFGEGGAGSYSDGKLFSRRDKNTSVVNQVLKTFVKFGAPPEIEYISKPHLGTDVLRRIVSKIRNYILDHGGEIHYSSRMTDLLTTEERAAGVIINDRDEYLAPAVFIALGHSARDTFQMLSDRGVALEQRAVSVGLRIEHPVEIIDRMRYGDKYCRYPGLGAATYSINYTDRSIKRGVYTFCMCPGGEIVNASSEHDMLVLNGMSYSNRGLPFSNGGLVVNCHTSDYGSEDPLAGLAFQRSIERKAFTAGGGQWRAPAQKLLHFLGEKCCNDIDGTSYRMEASPFDLHDIFPEFITRTLHAAFHKWHRELPLFVSEHALLLAAETRTSSPVRIIRDEKFMSRSTKNLYPIGEGAGYTGGITSSAADGLKAARAWCDNR